MKNSLVIRILGFFAGAFLLFSSAMADDVLLEVRQKNSDAVYQLTRALADKMP